MLRSLLVGVALLPAFYAPAAYAQAATQAQIDAEHRSEGLASVASSAPLDRSVSALQGIELRTVQDSSTATIRLGAVISEGEDFRTLSLGLSTPLSKSGDTRPATLDGLANATAIEFRFNQARMDDIRAPNVARDREVCRQAQINAGDQINPDSCTVEYVQQHNFAEADGYHSIFTNNHRLWLWGASARYGFQAFDWYDPATLAKNTQDENPWSASLYGGVAWPRHRAMVLLSLTAQDAFKDARSGVMCPGGPGPVTCVSGPIGAPNETESRIVALEYRQVLADRAGFALTTSYDTETEVYGVDLPVYLVQDSNNALTGGIRLGWTSDEHEVIAGVFVSKAFSFLDVTHLMTGR